MNKTLNFQGPLSLEHPDCLQRLRLCFHITAEQNRHGALLWSLGGCISMGNLKETEVFKHGLNWRVLALAGLFWPVLVLLLLPQLKSRL